MAANPKLRTVILVGLFFAWGLVGVLIRMTMPHLKDAFALGYRDALLIQSSFFAAYLLLSRLAGEVVSHIGFSRGATWGLGIMGAGCFALGAATLFDNFAGLLATIFLLATGVVILQVSANPLAAAQGHLASRAANLTFAQSFNSLGTVAAPILAGYAFLGGGTESLEPVRELFLVIGVVFFLLATAVHGLLQENPANASALAQAPLRERSPGTRLQWAVAALFVYVGAEVALSTTLLIVLEADWTIAASRDDAALLVSLFWLGMLAGRMLSVPLIIRVGRRGILATGGFAASLLCLLGAVSSGSFAALALIAVGLFASVQFPAIFAIASADLETRSKARAAGWLCTGIVGGAIIPVLFGTIADASSLRAAMLVPAACFVLVGLFALKFGARLNPVEGKQPS